MAAPKALIIDDEVSIVTLVSSRLKINGYEVISARDGQEGLEKVRSEKPDIILLDLMLPKLDGYKVCRMLKFDEKYKHIPIVIFTARTQESDEKLGFEVGADAYITKPFKSEVLIEKMHELLQGRGLL
ncbi:MAG: response regulator [Candidatus Omnitrophota bacterium]|nr:response regulator [Candidatus Omnitrophota bacterium]